ncbi:MAG: leucyl/phenylalanyl-tRNA--protein transferase [Shewanella sp.]|uniref:leucyl/phenylalanyl-tRNA--protein transferase n=1 Tax=Shewanella sp. SNU WT4 TaxID=2590015 RepID=UPI00112D744A|nr:leucyl/phenylalanyl-tRNA--protein transferase [Shewanella sp. SNU WT4]QDF67306.1 leucyl/phenylalanyl-tRNA--protein transferase [Shewanella sp. SNU WT4]
MNTLSYLDHQLSSFPSPEQALTEPNGLLAIGGDLSCQRLLSAYYHGIFPWFNQDDPILWWSPDPRAIFIPGEIHISASLKKSLKKQSWRFTINHSFSDVINACAAPRAQQAGTWISEQIISAYEQLHHQGRAHSFEVWQQDRLIGGLYGINIGQVFCGESMFHTETNASKAALIMLQQHLLRFNCQLIDAQVMNPHLQSLGAITIKRSEFLQQLYRLRQTTISAECWQPQEITLEL